jgi:hypothetical protein
VEDKQPSRAITKHVPHYAANFFAFPARSRGDAGFSVPNFCKILATEGRARSGFTLPNFVSNAVTNFG